jgi:hypothetical protein
MKERTQLLLAITVYIVILVIAMGPSLGRLGDEMWFWAFGRPEAPVPGSSLDQCEELRRGEWTERFRIEDSLRERLYQCEQLRQCPQRTICEVECQGRK